MIITTICVPCLVLLSVCFLLPRFGWLMIHSLTDISFFFFSSRRRHTRFDCDWSSDVCSSDLLLFQDPPLLKPWKPVPASLSVLLIALSLARSLLALVCRLPRFDPKPAAPPKEIGRASCRERV